MSKQQVAFDECMGCSSPDTCQRLGCRIAFQRGSANEIQVGGDHYCKYGDLQPWDTWVPWNLNGFQCNIIKYTVRYRDKDGLKDLEKARHYLDKLIEVERARADSGKL